MSHSPSPKTVVVAGATGYLGKHVVRALMRDGMAVRALARDPMGLEDIAPLGAQVVTGQATDPTSLDGLFEDADAAFSSIGVRHLKRHPTYEDVDFQANINLVEAAEAAGVETFVFVSILDGDQLRDLSPLIAARERVVDRLARSPMRSVILRPTGFFNDMSEIFHMAKKGKTWLIGTGETKLNPVHGADLADLVSEALLSPNPPAQIPAGGPEVFSQREIAELAFAILDRPARFGRVGPGLVRFVGRLLRPFNKNASALAMMFSMLGERDGIAPTYGTHRLEAHFRELADAP